MNIRNHKLPAALRALICALMMAVGSFHGITAQAASGGLRDRSPDVELAQFQSGRYGPYATIRRANEVANYFRNLGFNARVFYGGTVDYREYYVDVW